MKTAQIQMSPSGDKLRSFEKAREMIEQKVPRDTDFIALPEMFCCPYQTDAFADYAEAEGGTMWQLCSQLARSTALLFVCRIHAGIR
jgi:omega-amidase